MAAWLYAVVLGSSLVTLVALSRAGSTLFWRRDAAPDTGEPLDPLRMLAMTVLLLTSPLLVYFAAPVLAYLDATAAQLLHPSEYIQQVLTTQPFTPGGQP